MLTTLRELYSLVHKSDRRSMWIVFALTLLMAVTEAVGVASILPFISVATDPGIVQENPLLTSLYERFEFQSHSSFVFMLGVCSLLLLLSSIAFRGIALWAQLRFSHYQISSISSRMVSGYLHSKYEWFLNRNSSELGAKVLNEVGNVVHGALYPAMVAIANTLVSLCLLTVLIAVDPLVAVVGSLILSAVYVLIYIVVKRLLARIGHDRVVANKERYRVLQEAFRGIKAVKMGLLEDRFYGLFTIPALKMAKRSVTAALVSELPSLLMQALVFGGMLTVLLVLLSSQGSLDAALPYLALYSLAGYRLLPALQGIYKSASQVRFNAPAVTELNNDLVAAEELLPFERDTSSDESIEGLPRLSESIEIKDVSYTYPENTTPALRELNLSIPVRTSVGIVGSTGSGKTTLVDVILGLLEPQSGEIRVDETVLDGDSRKLWRRQIGYVPQHIHLVDGTIAENIAFGVQARRLNLELVEQAARIACIHDFILDELPDGYQTQTGENGVRLSGGQRQRIGIARAVYNDPEILVLDEATSALDTLTERRTMESIKTLGGEKTIIIIAHRLSTVRHCDKLVIMEDGEIEAQGSFDDLVQSSARFKKMAQT